MKDKPSKQKIKRANTKAKGRVATDRERDIIKAIADGDGCLFLGLSFMALMGFDHLPRQPKAKSTAKPKAKALEQSNAIEITDYRVIEDERELK